MEDVFAGEHLVHVTRDRVDLAVVDHESVRVRLLPARVRVRREPRVNDADSGNEFFFIKILIEKS